MRDFRIRKSISILLIFVIISSLYACHLEKKKLPNNPKEIIELITSKMSEIKNMECSTKAELGIKLDGMPLNMSMSQDMSMFNSPYKMKADTNIDLGIMGKHSNTMYLIGENKYYLYINEKNIWTAQELDLEGFNKSSEQYGIVTNINLYLDNKESFKLAGTEKINERNTTKIDGTITGSIIKNVIGKMGIAEELIDKSVLESIFEDSGDMPISVWIDEELLIPIKISIEMTNFVQNIINNISKSDFSITDSIEEILVNKCFVEINYKNFDIVEDFEIPEEAKDSLP